MANDNGASPKRGSKARIVYLAKDGAEAKLTDGPALIQFAFANGNTLDIDVAGLPKAIRNIAMVRGIAEKVRDTYAGAEDVDSAEETAREMVERLVAGEWMSEREGGGPSMTLFLEALKETKEAAGLPFDLEASRAKYVGKDAGEARKAALAHPGLRAVYTRMQTEKAQAQAERAAARAAEAAGASGDAPTVAVADL